MTTNKERIKIDKEERKKDRAHIVEEVKEELAKVKGSIENKLDNVWDDFLSRINDMEETITIDIKKMRGYFHTAIEERLKKWKKTLMSL